MITRFAPSPTGRLHLGHAYSAMIAHDLACAMHGRWLLRLDDLDTGRVRADYADAIIDDLAWLGLIPHGPHVRQSDRVSLYTHAIETLKAVGLAYPCFCTRGQIAAQIADSIAAPHGVDSVYPGTCRNFDMATRDARIATESHCWRLDMDAAVAQSGALAWQSQDAGRDISWVEANPALHGDIVLMRKDGAASYHLASTVDDAAMGMTHVVRGADLEASTDVHRILQAILGLPTPVYHHHRLIGDATGHRLAKRSKAAELASLRAAGVNPAAVMAGLRLGHLPLGYCWAKA